MKPKTAGAAAAGLMAALVGCTLTQQSLRDDALIPTVGGGQSVAPRRCVLRVMVASRPEGDPALAEAVWRAADEQAVDPEARRVLQANGLRIGRISGDLPGEVQEVLNAPPPRKVEAQTVVLPDGDPTLLDPGTPRTASISMMLGQKDKVVGKVFEDPRGFVKVAASFDGEDGVSVRLVPEIHHGPVRQGWSVVGGATPMTPGQIVPKNGQQEDAFRELAGTLVLRPGQVAVIGGRHDKRGSLGDFLFGEPDPSGDLPREKILFLWAARSETGTIDKDAGPPSGLVPFDPIDEAGAK